RPGGNLRVLGRILGHPAAIDGQHMAGHHGGLVGTQPDDAAGLLGGVDGAADGLVDHLFVDQGLGVLVAELVVRPGGGYPRGDAVDADAALGVADGGELGHADHPRLAGAVADAAVAVVEHPRQGGDIGDGTAAVVDHMGDLV